MARFLYFILLAIVVRYLWSAIAAWMSSELLRRAGAREREGAARGGSAAGALYKGVMVRDPVCGLHVPESRAVTANRAGELLHFCSERCKTRFLATNASRARA